ncbi:hydantoinase/oxoprolinase family protein [Vreelandella nanhaiensis]|uniref:Hydantoinase/oxoprolinase family protein n=1 Tax=Vreelandella nanhaiensis TaxID=1258546 RepID=A0A3S0XXT7_9GAMM|nr:hydantoinase/oxoprolinase family protein [Halomonas nanhaiensis]RUR32704.1 hydantoinase/oxoprolinase family protein [Halomonas nanhaiensis]
MGGSSIRVGVDIGGTFTDVALEKGEEMFSSKVLTNYTQPEQAIIDGITKAAETANISLSQIDTVIHGTTLATNSLIERRGAHTAFITTEGFRDVIEMRTESRFEQYDLNIVLPAPLIPRHDRYVIGGRIAASGEEMIPVDHDKLQEVIEKIRQVGYESVAVGLMHSYRNPMHEQQVKKAIEESLSGVSVSISSDVSPQIREYERFNTVCANAYVKPLMSSYLERLEERLKTSGMTCPVYLMHSGGGLISLRTAAKFPVRLLESGPAGGTIYASYIAEKHDLKRVVSFDMGGTTAKVCLINDMKPKTSRTFEVARSYRFKKGSGMPISIPVIEMVEIGAGGGSIASVDDLKQIRIGPESAGSEPGPACYGLGGEHPTVTDADLLLGKLDPQGFAGGSMRLDTEAARIALDRKISSQLGGVAEDAAYAISEVVNENMANAARMHAVESGCELETYTMVAFGGAAPVHAARLCQKLGVDSLLIPPGAGVGSAIGFLKAPFSYESLRSSVMRLESFDREKANLLIEDMRQEVESFVGDAGGDQEYIYELKAYMRYAGQGWEIPIEVSELSLSDGCEARLKQDFIAAYTQLFSHAVDGLDAEVVSWSLNVSSRLPTATQPYSNDAVDTFQDPIPHMTRQIVDASRNRPLSYLVYEREDLPPGARCEGPLVVVETETSTIVPPGYKMQVQMDGCLFIEKNKVENI